MEDVKTDICVIGAGSAGLSVAAGASQMGAKVFLIEKNVRNGIMGGDCLHTGCVPSKALLAAAKQAKLMGEGEKFGIAPQPANVDFQKVREHIQGVIREISPIDSTVRFEELGATVVEGEARFSDRRTVEVEGIRIKANRFVLATGSSAGVPPIPGIESVSYLTNETVFDLPRLPKHLIVIGAGPIGLELSQAFRRLGAQVTVLEAFKAMSKDDPALAKVVLDSLAADGVNIFENVKIRNVSETGGTITVTAEIDGKSYDIPGTHLLVAAGRKPTVEGLGLDAAGITYSSKGIEVDARLRTSNKRVFAIGDCVADSPDFTHVSSYHAGIVIRNALFKTPARADLSNLPWVTYTDPELAHVGLTEAQAREKHDDVKVIEWPYKENDRAQAERDTRGFLKVVARKNGRILGASIVGHNAGEVIQPWILALTKKMKMSDMTGYIAPYPTLGEINKRAAGQFFTSFLFGPRVKFIVRMLQRLG